MCLGKDGKFFGTIARKEGYCFLGFGFGPAVQIEKRGERLTVLALPGCGAGSGSDAGDR